MASVTVDLTGYTDFANSNIEWADDVSIGPTFDAGGSNQTIIAVSLRYAIIPGAINISIDGTNNRFTAAFVASGRIIFEASDGETLEVMIADADITEPYTWVPTNSQEVVDFANHVRGLTDHDATLTLTDNPPGIGGVTAYEKAGGSWAERAVHTAYEKVAGVWVERAVQKTHEKVLGAWIRR